MERIRSFNWRTYLIPPAPNCANATTRGVKFTVNNNDANAWISGMNIYPKNKSFSGNYVLKFDLWINYPGHAGVFGSGVAGSTEHAIFGINHLGVQSELGSDQFERQRWNLVWSGWKGGRARDYRAYIGNLSGNPTELTTSASSGLGTFDNASGFYPALFTATRFETVGAPGKNWVAVEVMQSNNVVVWKLDGTIVAQRNNSTFTNGNMMIGLMDTFSSISSPAKDSFVIFDNVRVEDLSELRFGSVVKLPDGKIQMSLNGVSGENYWIEGSTNLVNWEPLSLLPGSNVPSIFVDDAVTNLPFRFHRARRNSAP